MRGVFLVAVLWAVAASARAQPEMRGPHTFTEWDAGRLPFAGTMIRTRVLFPNDDPGPFPVVGVIHGATRTGAQQIETARTFASRGFVVLLPDLPCLSVGGCDHDANANQILAMIDWAIAESAGSTSMIAGRIDPARRGLVGHSWGALAVHLAAARDARIGSVVLFDPNDDGTVGRDATPTIRAPVMQLLAAATGVCNNQWMEAAVTPMLPAPNVQLTISGSAHCDPEDPSDALCTTFCGRGDSATRFFFRRYAIAWTECNLTASPAVADWLGGPQMTADEAAMIIEGVIANGLDTLPCRTGVLPSADAGIPDVDAAVPDLDAGTPELDAGTPEVDGGTDTGSTSPLDAGAMPTADAGRAMDAGTPIDAGAAIPPTTGGCGCSARTARPRAGLGLAFLLGLLAHRRRERRASRARDSSSEPRSPSERALRCVESQAVPVGLAKRPRTSSA